MSTQIVENVQFGRLFMREGAVDDVTEHLLTSMMSHICADRPSATDCSEWV